MQKLESLIASIVPAIPERNVHMHVLQNFLVSRPTGAKRVLQELQYQGVVRIQRGILLVQCFKPL